MKKTLTAALLLAAGLAAAQTSLPADGAAPAPTAPNAQPGQVKNLNQNIRADQKEIRVDKRAIRQDNAAQRAQIADLNAQEKTAMEAVTANTTLSKSDSNAAKRKIHADFKAKKDAIRIQMKIARRSKRADISAERSDIRKNRQERGAINTGGR